MLLSHPLAVVAIAVLVWWISTGLVLFVVRRTEGENGTGGLGDTSLAMMTMMSVVAILGIILLVVSKHMLTPLGSYIGFFGALLLWAWHEASFLSGLITGPRKGDCPQGVDQWGRFKAAWEAVRSHEIAIAVTVLLLYWLMMDAVNTFGFWTFMLLWIMRISAKLIIFLGARNALSDMMPKRISHLKTYFNTSHTSFLFFVSVSLASLAFVLLCIGAYETGEPYMRVGHVLLASFMALGNCRAFHIDPADFRCSLVVVGSSAIKTGRPTQITIRRKIPAEEAADKTSNWRKRFHASRPNRHIAKSTTLTDRLA